MTDIEKQTRKAPLARDWMSWFEDWPQSRWFPEFGRGHLAEAARMVRVEEFQEDGALVVKAEMPGMDPDKDIRIDVSDHTLHIQAERREETEAKEKDAYRSEFRYGSFSRQVPLPAGASDDDVKATYKDGILEVRVAIDRAKAEARKVPVQRI